MSTQTLEIYEILKKLVPEQEASRIVTYIEDVKDKEISVAVDRKIEHTATKEDIANLRADIGYKFTEHLRWMFGLWITQLAAIAGILFAILKK